VPASPVVPLAHAEIKMEVVDSLKLSGDANEDEIEERNKDISRNAGGDVKVEHTSPPGNDTLLPRTCCAHSPLQGNVGQGLMEMTSSQTTQFCYLVSGRTFLHDNL